MTLSKNKLFNKCQNKWVKKNKVIVFTANSSWYIYNFKLSLIKLLISKDFTVHVISPIDDIQIN